MIRLVMVKGDFVCFNPLQVEYVRGDCNADTCVVGLVSGRDIQVEGNVMDIGSALSLKEEQENSNGK